MYRFYRMDTSAAAASQVPLPEGCRSRLWRPSLTSLKPPEMPRLPFLVWGLFHHLRIFRNRDYAILIISSGGKMIHCSLVIPPYFKFPFMAARDLQIGDTWTDPEQRGKGLAARAIEEILKQMGNPGRAFWYLVREDNAASIKVAEKQGFRCVGLGSKRAPFGLPVIGRYLLEERRD